MKRCFFAERGPPEPPRSKRSEKGLLRIGKESRISFSCSLHPHQTIYLVHVTSHSHHKWSVGFCQSFWKIFVYNGLSGRCPAAFLGPAWAEGAGAVQRLFWPGLGRRGGRCPAAFLARPGPKGQALPLILLWQRLPAKKRALDSVPFPGISRKKGAARGRPAPLGLRKQPHRFTRGCLKNRSYRLFLPEAAPTASEMLGMHKVCPRFSPCSCPPLTKNPSISPFSNKPWGDGYFFLAASNTRATTPRIPKGPGSLSRNSR